MVDSRFFRSMCCTDPSTGKFSVIGSLSCTNWSLLMISLGKQFAGKITASEAFVIFVNETESTISESLFRRVWKQVGKELDISLSAVVAFILIILFWSFYLFGFFFVLFFCSRKLCQNVKRVCDSQKSCLAPQLPLKHKSPKNWWVIVFLFEMFVTSTMLVGGFQWSTPPSMHRS